MPFELSIIQQIARKHRLVGEPKLLPNTGMVNEAWAIGEELILRICRDAGWDKEAAIERAAVPLACAAGVRTPELLVYDYDRDIVQTPYTVYRRVHGVLLGHSDIDPSIPQALYQELGREFALMHSITIPEEARNVIIPSDPSDLKGSLQRSVDKDAMTEAEAERVKGWGERLEWCFESAEADTLVHKDIHPWNMIVNPETLELQAIIDWGDAALGDPAVEFASMPLVAVKSMLEGYAKAGGMIGDAFIGRSLYAGFTLMAWELRGADPKDFKRAWWRLPPGGWDEVAEFVRANFPHLALE